MVNDGEAALKHERQWGRVGTHRHSLSRQQGIVLVVVIVFFPIAVVSVVVVCVVVLTDLILKGLHLVAATTTTLGSGSHAPRWTLADRHSPPPNRLRCSRSSSPSHTCPCTAIWRPRTQAAGARSPDTRYGPTPNRSPGARVRRATPCPRCRTW